MTTRAPLAGIDLGTSNSCVAVYQDGAPRIVCNREGQRTTPSVVAIHEDGRVVVGAPARRQAALHPKNTLRAVKRLVGRRFDTPEVRAMQEAHAFEIVKAPNGDAWVQIGARRISPPEVLAHVLDKMRAAVAAELGQPPRGAVVTVPAHFDEAQRQATRDAGTMAGLEVVRILNEPTAAALAYGLARAHGEHVAVCDLGGGTFDVTVMLVEDGVCEVLATAGDVQLGGVDFDQRIARLLCGEAKRVHGIDVGADPVATQRILDEAEAAKCTLSELDEAHVALPFLGMGEKGPIHFERAITRPEVEVLTRDLLDRLAAPCRQALADAKLAPGAIRHVLLVGGMARMPAVQHELAAIFGSKPKKGVHPDEAVAMGAALETAILEGALTDVVLVDVASHTIGVRAAGDKLVPVIRRGTVIPARGRKVFSTTEDDQAHVNVDVHQGEDPVASKNRHLARLRLFDLPRAPKGEVHIELGFAVDASGLLSVTARDLTSGAETSLEVVARSGLGSTEVARIASERRAARGHR